jgi:CBS domain-containing protein
MFDKKIRDVMSSPVACLTPAASVRDAAQKMRELDIGIVVVCEEDSPVGVATDRDVAVRCAALGLDPATCRLSEIMTTDIVTCRGDQTTREAEALMEKRQIRRLIVIDDGGKLRGVLALSDLAAVDRGMTGRIVERVLQPSSGFAIR